MATKLSTIDEAARYFAVSKSTIRSWIRRGMLPVECYVKIGNTYRFDIEKMVAMFKPEAYKPVVRWADLTYKLETEGSPELQIDDLEGLIDSVPPAEDIVDPTAAEPREPPAPPRVSPVDVFGDLEDEDEPN